MNTQVCVLNTHNSIFIFWHNTQKIQYDWKSHVVNYLPILEKKRYWCKIVGQLLEQQLHKSFYILCFDSQVFNCIFKYYKMFKKHILKSKTKRFLKWYNKITALLEMQHNKIEVKM